MIFKLKFVKVNEPPLQIWQNVTFLGNKLSSSAESVDRNRIKINSKENMAARNPGDETRATGKFAPRISRGHFSSHVIYHLALRAKRKRDFS